jgi:[ribosomal protein S5]-alanine N-acetyltransferase
MYRICDWENKDAEVLALIANNANIAQFMTNGFPHPYSLEDAKKFIKMAISHPTSIIKAIEIDHNLAGGIGLHPQNDIYQKNAELGFWLAEKYWGKGVMTNAIKDMIKIGFSSLDIDRIYAIPFGTNQGSIAVLEKAGFKLEAVLEKTIYKNGQFLDELIYAVRRN